MTIQSTPTDHAEAERMAYPSSAWRFSTQQKLDHVTHTFRNAGRFV